MDSGYSRHMTGNKDNLLNYKSYQSPKVSFGDDGKGNVVRKEDLIIRNIKISDISHVEGLKYNLLNVSQFIDKGCTVEFNSHGCQLLHKSSRGATTRASRGRPTLTEVNKVADCIPTGR